MSSPNNIAASIIMDSLLAKDLSSEYHTILRMTTDPKHEEIRRTLLDFSTLNGPILAEVFANTPDTFVDAL